jgi:GT2 family glycosyltransferase
VYLADDDNVFEATLLEDIIDTMQKYSFEAITMSYLKKDEVERTKQPIQWSTFGAGSSVINSKFLNKIAFNLALEFGYGEDVDFGMQLRNLGIDIIYFPNIKILHLNAPMGGFRTRFIHPWENDKVQPKPSPTIMLNRMLNVTTHQTLGYKTVLFFKYYKRQSIKNPMDYYKSFNKKWEQSVYWANQLKVKNK